MSLFESLCSNSTSHLKSYISTSPAQTYSDGFVNNVITRIKMLLFQQTMDNLNFQFVICIKSTFLQNMSHRVHWAVFVVTETVDPRYDQVAFVLKPSRSTSTALSQHKIANRYKTNVKLQHVLGLQKHTLPGTYTSNRQPKSLPFWWTSWEKICTAFIEEGQIQSDTSLVISQQL